jgi:predicted RNA-binding Zn ribbon-like protein
MAKQTTEAGLGVCECYLCLDFVNTEGEERNDPPERLETLDRFLDWAVRHGVVENDRVESLLDAARAAPGSVEKFLERAREFREAIYRIFSAVAGNAAPNREDLAVLNRELADALPRLSLVQDNGTFRWELQREGRRLEELLWPVASSAADLLRSRLLARVKECRSDTCSWMFIDESRNRSRRWCDMSDCGNRAKARRYYQRHVRDKTAGSASPG